MIPVGFNPAQFMQSVCAPSGGTQKLDFKKGTTTLGFVFDGGVIVAVDSRATMGCN